MQSTKCVDCCIRQRDKSRSVSHVGGHSQGLPTIRHDLVDHALHAVDVSCCNNDRRPRGREVLGDSFADSLAAASDDRDLSVEVK